MKRLFVLRPLAARIKHFRRFPNRPGNSLRQTCDTKGRNVRRAERARDYSGRGANSSRGLLEFRYIMRSVGR